MPTGSLAEFAVYLAAIIDQFIMKRWVEMQHVREEREDEDEVPF